VQRARPSYNPRGTCPRWADRPAAQGGGNPAPDSSLAHGWGVDRGGGAVMVMVIEVGPSVCRAHTFALGAALAIIFFLPVLFHPRFLTSMRSCNGHAPLIIQEGCARAGQNVQPRRVGQTSALCSSLAREGGGGEQGCRARKCCCTRKCFCTHKCCLFCSFSSLPTS
jgi:hypothetical protein